MSALRQPNARLWELYRKPYREWTAQDRRDWFAMTGEWL